ncbi:MAG: hypothetical protein L0I62_05100 [Gammaproteobacteria bacterium]|nr:hypothetical protein [Gammaproteobacteria bacterium]
MDKESYQRKLRNANAKGDFMQVPQYGDRHNPWLEERKMARERRRQKARAHSAQRG